MLSPLTIGADPAAILISGRPALFVFLLIGFVAKIFCKLAKRQKIFVNRRHDKTRSRQIPHDELETIQRCVKKSRLVTRLSTKYA